jgi:hypothetical protein
MTDLIGALTEHLRSKADQAQPVPDLGSVVDGGLRVSMTPSDPKRRGVLIAAAAIIVVGVAGIIAVSDDGGSPPSTTPSSTIAGPVSPADDVPRIDATVVPRELMLQRPDVFAALPADDPRNENSSGGYLQMAMQNPDRVNALVGRFDGERLTGGIQIQTISERSADTFAFAGDPTIATIDGVDVEVFSQQGTPVIATAVVPGDLTITYTGLDPVAFLEQVGVGFAAADWSDGVGTLTIDRSLLPVDYEVIVEPTPNSPPRSLMASTSFRVSADEEGSGVSMQLEDPVLSWATAGDLQRTEVGGSPAWLSDSAGHAVSWKVTETTWAIMVGAESAQASLSIANDLEFVDEATWRKRYRVEEPLFDGVGGDVISIDQGALDGLQVGMAVVNAEGLVGKLASVTDSRSDVLLLSDPRFSVAAVTSDDPTGRGCSVGGRTDHVGYFCESEFGLDVAIGATIATSGVDSRAPAGIEIGTVTSIGTSVDDEPVAFLRTADGVVAGDSLTVLLYKP